MRRVVLLIAILLFGSYFLIAQVKEDILKKHLNAIGGAKNWNNVKTIRSVGLRESDGSIIEKKKQKIVNKAIRIDYTYQSRDKALNDKKFFIIVNGNQGWKYLPDNLKDSIETMTSGEIAYYKNEHFTLSPFLPKENMQPRIEYISKEDVMNTPCFKFSVNHTTGKTEFIYIDTKTYLIRKSISITSDSEVEFDYEEYKQVNQKITIPYKITSTADVFQMTQFEVNQPLNEQLFIPSMK